MATITMATIPMATPSPRPPHWLQPSSSSMTTIPMTTITMTTIPMTTIPMTTIMATITMATIPMATITMTTIITMKAFIPMTTIPMSTIPIATITMPTIAMATVAPRPPLTPAELLLLQLTSSHLLLLLFLPFKMAEEASSLSWPFPVAFCLVTNFCFYSFTYLSTLLLAALSVERYLGVAAPHGGGGRRRLWGTVAVSALLWGVALGHCSIVFVAEYSREQGEYGGWRTSQLGSSHCYHDFSPSQLRLLLPFRLELFLLLFLVPFMVTLYCYTRLIRTLWIRPHIPVRKKRRAIGLAVVTVLSYGLCFGPYNVSHVVGFVQHTNPEWRPYALLLTAMSAALDPIIFYCSASGVRRAACGVMGGIWGRVRGLWGRGGGTIIGGYRAPNRKV
ncbi:LOW QUALITY PROTEIN: free fatty acid receptor 2-like [Excalfactoria chinensis]|uniref:LOW QUALITY PROTEIN: free fatty acid receptor 2-like n=1 Tax=Excalfactoria chinensis TaxID=46218 RepID=UPI003B3A0574